MILTRSPLRITISGGGTDLPSYYENYGGSVLSVAIDKYVYVATTKPYSDGIYLKYSDIEKTQSVKDVKHPIIRESLKKFIKKDQVPSIEIVTLADIPSGTGLGSSSSFTNALLKNLYFYYEDKGVDKDTIAKEACEIEINKVGSPIGKQDQYSSAYGGLSYMQFNKDGSVNVSPFEISKSTFYDLEDNLMLFFTGYSREAGSILKEQDDKTKNNNEEMVNNLKNVEYLGSLINKALLDGDTKLFGEYMDEHWKIKKERSPNMTNPKIDEWYEKAKKNGAIGGKLVGAGGGGFLMFYANDPRKLRLEMEKQGLSELRFRFSPNGVERIL